MNTVFANALKTTFDNEVTTTENGAAMFKTSGRKLVDCNFELVSFRNKSDAEVIKSFSDAYYENKEYAVRWLFMIRDVRGGQGERKTFRTLFRWLASADADSVKKLVPYIAEYGRFDDLFCLFGTSVENCVYEYIDTTFASDMSKMKDGKPVTLLAKWLPSVNASSKTTRELGRAIAKKLNLTECKYRKALAALRKHIDVVETKMSAKDWKNINYCHVSSMANLRYGKAFLKNDPIRRQAYLDALKTGDAKINASACFPSDIAFKYMKSWNFTPDTQLEAMWKAIPQIGCDDKNIITVVDTSGSMSWYTCTPNTKMRPLDVAFGLGVYCAEHLKGPFKDKCITFNSTPEYIDLSGRDTLAKKLERLADSNVGGSTNIEAVMDLILNTAVQNKIEQKDLPNVVILTDMGFDPIHLDGQYRDNTKYDASRCALFAQISDKYKAAGYDLPKVFFWNLNSRTESQGIPLQNSEYGVGLVSGYSQNTVKMLLSDKTDPWDILKEQLDSDRYAMISEILAA